MIITIIITIVTDLTYKSIINTGERLLIMAISGWFTLKYVNLLMNTIKGKLKGQNKPIQK